MIRLIAMLAAAIISAAPCETLTPIPEPVDIICEANAPQTVSLGEYKITAYCPCAKCCGKNDGITSTGVLARQGRTIAVDPQKIAYGDRVIINGHTYTAEDCGGAIKGNRIDVYFDSHEDALEFGVQYAEVFLDCGF